MATAGVYSSSQKPASLHVYLNEGHPAADTKTSVWLKACPLRLSGDATQKPIFEMGGGNTYQHHHLNPPSLAKFLLHVQAVFVSSSCSSNARETKLPIRAIDKED